MRKIAYISCLCKPFYDYFLYSKTTNCERTFYKVYLFKQVSNGTSVRPIGLTKEKKKIIIIM